jgi:recombination DNA repair RAD52 pathway protein
MSISQKQYEQLLKPLNPKRVATRSQAGRSLSYLEAWDVKAHLIRVFGFCGWSADVRSADVAFEEKNEKGNWDVGYKVVLCLRIHTEKDSFLGEATYTEAAVGSASLPRRGDAHDMAIKTAESDALKRAAINLGTQFGLSLYNDGSMHDVVIETLVPPVSQLGTDE